MLHEIKVISCNQTRYKPTLETRAVDKRADQLHQEYVDKAKNVDQKFGGAQPGEVGRRVEAKLSTFPKVEGLVFGNWCEGSEAVHALIESIASNRASVADPQSRSKKGKKFTENGVKGLAVGFLRRKISITA